MVNLSEAVERLIMELRSDKDYFRSWRDSISISFQDEYWRRESKDDIREISNVAAENFLRMLSKKPVDVVEIAETLYRQANPESKMDTPSSVYESVESWNREWQKDTTDIDFISWINKNKLKI